MRIPPYYRSPTWQRFFAGVAVGALVSWLFFLYSFGYYQEKQVEIIATQKKTIAQLQNDIEIWQRDYKELNKRNLELLTVQHIEIEIQNANKYKLDKLMEYSIENNIKSDLADLIAKDIDSVIKTRHLIAKTIENKVYQAEDKEFKAKVVELVITPTIIIEVELVLNK